MSLWYYNVLVTVIIILYVVDTIVTYQYIQYPNNKINVGVLEDIP